MHFVRANGSASSPQMIFKKTRGTTDATTANATGDDIGMLRFYSLISTGSGNAYDEVARITVDTVGAPDAGAYRIYTAPTGGAVTQRVHIGPTGLNGFGNATPSQTLDVTGRIKMTTWTADGTAVAYRNATAGNGQNCIGILASDRRLKKDLELITDPIGKVQAITGYTYRNINDSADVIKKYGVMAQDVMSVAPELTYEFNNEEDPTTYYSVHYDKLPALLIEAFKEQQKIIDDLKARIILLENSS